MKKLKIIYNINNLSSIIDDKMGIIFAIVDESDQTNYSYQLKIKCGLIYYPEQEFDHYFLEETIIGFGNNGTSTRIIKDLDKEDIELFTKLISNYSPGTLKEYLDLILDQII